MALFKKSVPTAEEIVELIEQMSDDEKDKLAGILTEDLSDGDIDGESDDKEGETTEQIEEAERDIEEKGEDSQSEKDRIDESVGEQEKLDNDEDSQDAKDRVDEAEGEENYLEEKREEKHEENQDERFAKIEALLLKIAKAVSADGNGDVEEAAKEIYGLGNGVFTDSKGSASTKNMTSSDVAKTINKLMR